MLPSRQTLRTASEGAAAASAAVDAGADSITQLRHTVKGAIGELREDASSVMLAAKAQKHAFTHAHDAARMDRRRAAAALARAEDAQKNVLAAAERRSGLTPTAHHVIQHIMNPRFSSSTAAYDVARDTYPSLSGGRRRWLGRADAASHVIVIQRMCMVSPRFLSKMTSYDVASHVYETLGDGGGRVGAARGG